MQIASRKQPRWTGTPVQEYILKLRDHGSSVDTMVVISAARGLTEVIEPTRLSEHGGPATLSVA